MARFFVDSINSDTYMISGADALHIIKSLRMKIGEELTLCDKNGVDHVCRINEIVSNEIRVSILDRFKCPNEPNVEVTIYQGLPKGDKMELIIQKAVELGVHKIVPMMTSRCVSRPDDKSIKKKNERWQKISEEAAKQSNRGLIPKVCELIDIKRAIKFSKESDRTIVFYECGGEKIGDLLPKDVRTISVFIGPEGGFEPNEVHDIIQSGGFSATLGRRILRTETAPLAALSTIMYLTGNM